MNEPTYEYIKGHGWVVQNNTLTMRDGVNVRIEFRRPKTDEYGLWTHTPFTVWDTDRWIKWTKENTWSYVSEYLNGGPFAPRGDVNWCTFIKV